MIDDSKVMKAPRDRMRCMKFSASFFQCGGRWQTSNSKLKKCLCVSDAPAIIHPVIMLM